MQIFFSYSHKAIRTCKYAVCAHMTLQFLLSVPLSGAFLCYRHLFAWLFLQCGGQQNAISQQRFLAPTVIKVLNNKSIDKSTVKTNASKSRLGTVWYSRLVNIRCFLAFPCPLSKRSILKNSNPSRTDGETLY